MLYFKMVCHRQYIIRPPERRSRRTRNDMVDDISSADDGRRSFEIRQGTRVNDTVRWFANLNHSAAFQIYFRDVSFLYDRLRWIYDVLSAVTLTYSILCIGSTHEFSFGYEKQEINKRCMHSRKTQNTCI